MSIEETLDKDANRILLEVMMDRDIHNEGSTEVLKEEIAEYNTSNPGVLENPININSTKQLAALLYDVIKLSYLIVITIITMLHYVIL